MPMRVRQRLDNVRVRLQRAGGAITKEVNDALQKEAEKIQKKARDYAPLEHGPLMNAIKVENLDRRTAWAVFVDRDAPDDTDEYTVGLYYLRLHEESDWKPGPKTVWPRGPKYLERAYRERAEGFTRRMREAASRALKKGGF